MDERLVGKVVAWCVVGLLCWQVYLLLFRPLTWIEWMVRKPWKSFGIAVSVENEKRLRMATLLYGLAFLSAAIFIIAAIIVTRFGCVYRLLGMPCRG